jgi:hypothetical protein
VFVGTIIVCWLYKLTLSDQAKSIYAWQSVFLIKCKDF